MEIKSIKTKKSSKNHHQFRFGNVDPENAWAYHNIQFYLYPPQETISLAELRDLVSFRQKVLTTVESVGFEKRSKQSNEYQHDLDRALRQIDFKVAITSLGKESDSKNGKGVDKEQEWLQYRRQDYLSHFVSRLPYCSTSDLRQWFIQQEVDLFRFRFATESSPNVKNFLQLYGIPTELVESEERAEVEPIVKQLITLGQKAPPGSEEPDPKLDIFKVYFAEATDLVRNRKVLLRRGYAYVPYKELTSVVVGRFRSNLSRELTTMSKFNDVIQEDLRLAPILKSSSSNNSSTGLTETSDSQNIVTADMIDQLSKESFPPCTRMIYKQLRIKHHLRHQGRMQLGLFFKGIGLPLEESLKLWKEAFAPVVDSDKFDKQYAYNIRHNYGKEGKRVEYSPFNCLKIITNAPPGPSDCHGCPFKIMDPPILRQHLENWGVSGEQMEKIVDLSQTQQYDRACSRYFEFIHDQPEGSINQLISHPNHFYDESRKLRLNKTAVVAEIDRMAY